MGSFPCLPPPPTRPACNPLDNNNTLDLDPKRQHDPLRSVLLLLSFFFFTIFIWLNFYFFSFLMDSEFRGRSHNTTPGRVWARTQQQEEEGNYAHTFLGPNINPLRCWTVAATTSTWRRTSRSSNETIARSLALSSWWISRPMTNGLCCALRSIALSLTTHLFQT